MATRNNPLEYIRPNHLESLKGLIPHLAIGLEVYLFGDAARRKDYTGPVQLEVLLEGCRFLHEMTEDQIQQVVQVAEEYGIYSVNPEDWDPRDDCTVTSGHLTRRIRDLFHSNPPYTRPESDTGDGILEAQMVKDGALVDLAKDSPSYGGVVSYTRFLLRYQKVEFEVYATKDSLPGSESIRRLTIGQRIIGPDDTIGAKSYME